MTVFRPSGDSPAPLIVIAHGFAGSQQLMQPFATTLARNGYLAVTFDLPGHGRNPRSLPGSFLESDERDQALLSALEQVIQANLAASDGRVGLLGHSMAAQLVLRYAAENPAVGATVAVSAFSVGDVTPGAPRNLLLVDGALEPGNLRAATKQAVALSFGAESQPATTYGDFVAGTARRYRHVPDVEHIGVLYSAVSLQEALHWFDQAFGEPVERSDKEFLDRRGGALLLLYFGILMLAWPLCQLLPRLPAGAAGAGLAWRRLLLIAAAPAVLTPLLVWKLPFSLLPVILADYLVLHFAVYGLLLLVGLRLSGAPMRVPGGALWLMLAAGVAAYGIFAFGLATDRYATAFLPGPARWMAIPVLMLGTLPFFMADEWLTRGRGAPRFAWAATKLLFLLSLLVAVALNPYRLFFLLIIVPVMLLFFLIYGLISRWVYGRTGQPLVAGVANGAIFAWAIAASFPLAAA